MAVNRFDWFLSNLHINDNTEQKDRGVPGYDKLFKVRPLLNSSAHTFKSCYNPTRVQSIDESLIAFKGRSSIKQYMPNKSTKKVTKYGQEQMHLDVFVNLIFTQEKMKI